MSEFTDRIQCALVDRREAQWRAAREAHYERLRSEAPPYMRPAPAALVPAHEAGGLPYPWCYRRAECAAARCCVGNPTCGD